MSELARYGVGAVRWAPHPESPNGLWIRIGYTVERMEKRVRVIRRPDGSVVDTKPRDNESRYDAETRAAYDEITRAGRYSVDFE